MAGLEDGRVGIALSGGGHRATLYSLGALVYFVDSRINEHVTAVTSVSGGSFANAYVGLHSKFDQAAASPFASLAGRYMCHIAHGVDRRRRFALRVALPLLIAVLALVTWLNGGIRPILGLGVAAVVGSIWGWVSLSSGALLRTTATNFIEPGDGYVKDATPLTDLYTGVDHVICATDVEAGDPTHGRHLHFTGSSVSSSVYGKGLPATVSVASAVQASAAYPIGLRRVRIRTGGLGFDSGPPSGSFTLVDAGLHDNLGLSWFRLSEEAGDRDGFAAIFVINAAWFPPYRRVRLFASLRSMSIMHQSNVAARVQACRDRLRSALLHGGTPYLVVSIGSPVAAVIAEAEQLSNDVGEPARSQITARAASLRKFLEERYGHRAESAWWEALAEEAREVKTTLFRIPAAKASAVVFQGYILTLTNAWLYLGVIPPAAATRQYDDFQAIIRKTAH